MKSIFQDVVFRQGVSFTSETILSFQTLCSGPTSLQPIYPSRHCAQVLQVFNQSILPDIVLTSYNSSTNLSFYTLCSDKVLPTSLKPIYPSKHCVQTLHDLLVLNQSILPDIVVRQGITYKSLTTLSFQ